MFRCSNRKAFVAFLGEQLTEAVVKEIELKTPYKVVAAPAADSTLIGRVFEESKYAITENANDELRDIELEMFVEVNWLNRSGQPLAAASVFQLPNGFEQLGQAVHIVPEGGQSVAVGHQQMISKLAQQIVAGMERAW